MVTLLMTMSAPIATPNHPIFCILHRHSYLRNGCAYGFERGTLGLIDHSKSQPENLILWPQPADEKSSLKGAW